MLLFFRLLIPSALVLLVVTASSVERHKRQLLKALNLSARPPLIHRPPLIPYSLGTRSDLYGGVMEKITLETRQRSWTCLTPESLVPDCFHYSLEPIRHEVMSASLVLDTVPPSDVTNLHSNFTIVIYEVDELFGELHFVDSFEVIEGGMQVTFDVTSHLQNWIRRRQNVKMVKIELIGASSNLRLHDSMLSPPHFEVTLFQPNSATEHSECAGCCVVPFYVNFTEIGWDDWILSPPGFYANFCSGTCSPESDETYQFMKASVSDPSMIPAPTCVPSYYGSVDFVVALGPRDIRKTRVHGMRALACSCS